MIYVLTLIYWVSTRQDFEATSYVYPTQIECTKQQDLIVNKIKIDGLVDSYCTGRPVKPHG